MPSRRRFLLSAATGLAALAAAHRYVSSPAAAASAHSAGAAKGPYELTHTDAEWRQLLTPQQYAVLRQGATEQPYSSPLDEEHRSGIFACAGCGQHVFSSAAKFDSHTGWPSFWAPLSHAIATAADWSLLMLRTEVHCQRCGGHLGHVFHDGPPPTGLRYCINGVALTFAPGPA